MNVTTLAERITQSCCQVAFTFYNSSKFYCLSYDILKTKFSGRRISNTNMCAFEYTKACGANNLKVMTSRTHLQHLLVTGGLFLRTVPLFLSEQPCFYVDNPFLCGQTCFYVDNPVSMRTNLFLNRLTVT